MATGVGGVGTDAATVGSAEPLPGSLSPEVPTSAPAGSVGRASPAVAGRATAATGLAEAAVVVVVERGCNVLCPDLARCPRPSLAKSRVVVVVVVPAWSDEVVGWLGTSKDPGDFFAGA